MSGISREGAEKTLWIVSLAALAFLYGFLSCGWGWFPSSQLTRALAQARRVATPPAFVAPRVHDRQGARTVVADRAPPGATLVASNWRSDDWLPGLRLIDRRGRVLHEWRIDPVALFGGGDEDPSAADRGLAEHEIHGTYLFPDGDVLVNVEHVGTARLDACGSVRWTLPRRTHHSIARAEDGTFWIPAGSPPDDASPDAGAPRLPEDTYRYRILHVSAAGEVLSEIDVMEVLFRNGLERFVARARYTGEAPLPGVDLTHLNDVEPLPSSVAPTYEGFEAGDLLVSLRNIDMVLVLDPETGRVRWHRDGPWLQQHDPDFMGDGWIGVFDNARDGTERGTLLGGSRVVAVHPATDSVRVLFPREGSEEFYTKYLGKWQGLDGGSLLLTEGNAGRVLEVDPDGSTVWEWVVEPYDDEGVPYVTEGTRYDLSAGDVAGWPCADGPGEASGSGGGRAG